MDTTVFYSWQSDDPKTRRHIEKALSEAVNQIAENPDIELAPRLDKDTQGASGAVHIVDTIKKKINECGIFLADVSLVDTASSGRAIVNQNVMFELGYAMGVHTESKVILVANTDLGDISKLPFDISHHRVIAFSMSADKKGARLEAALQSAISVHLDTLEKEKRTHEAVSAKDKLVGAIENDKPRRLLSNRYFKDKYAEYLALAPTPYDGGDAEAYKQEVYEAYLSSKQISLELFEVLNMAADYARNDVLISAFKNLEEVSQYYDPMPGDPNPSYDISREYYAFIVYEVIALVLGLIAREKLWPAMKDITQTKLSSSESHGGIGRKFDDLYEWPQHSLDYYKKLKNANYSVPTSHLVKERFKDHMEALQAYVDGSLLRYFINNDYPWAIDLLMNHSWERYLPKFIQDFADKEFVLTLKALTGEETLDEFKNNIWSQVTKSMGYMPYFRNMEHLFKHFGINDKDDIYGGTKQKITTL